MLSNNKKDISSNIERNIITAIRVAIQSDAKESFYSLDDFIAKSLTIFFKEDSLIEFIDFLMIVEQYYIISNTIAKKNHNDTSNVISSRCSKRLYETMFFPKYDFEKASFEKKNRINKYIYQIFKSFNRVFFETVKDKDLSGFKRNVEQLNLIFMGDNADLFPLSDSLQTQTIGENKNEIFINMMPQIYYNHTLMGVRYWIYHLFEKDQIDAETMKGFTESLDNSKKINTFFWEIEYLFSELNSYKGLHLYGWNSWDYETHEEGAFYSPPNVQSWITKGYAIDSLIKGSMAIMNVNSEIISDNPDNKNLLIGTLRKDIENVLKDSKWKSYFADKDDSTIKRQLDILEFSFVSKKAKEIANTPLDEVLIEEYKKRFLSAWKENQNIRKLFEYFGKKREYTGKQKLKINGRRIYFENAKVLFIKGKHHVDIHGAENYGRQMNVDEETYFFNKVISSKMPRMYESLKQGIDDLIEVGEKYKANAIIIDSNILLANRFLTLLKKTEGYPIYSYKGIPVFTSNNDAFRKSFIIANFENAFTMLYRKDDKLLDNELKVDVHEVTQEVLAEKLLSVENSEISQEDNQNQIMSSVMIDFEVIIDFIIDDINAYDIGYIDEL